MTSPRLSTAMIAGRNRSFHHSAPITARRSTSPKYPAVAMAVLSISALLWVVPAPSLAQKSDEPVEEIVVFGEKSLQALRTQIIDAETRMLNLFNSLNSDNEFDITCEVAALSGSAIRQRVCDIQYMKIARSDAAKDYVLLDNPVPSEYELQVMNAHKRDAANKELAELVVEHRELATAIIEVRKLKRRYLEMQSAGSKDLRSDAKVNK